MVCDYYVKTQFHVLTKDGKKYFIDYEREPRYDFGGESDDYSYEEYMQRRIEGERENKLLFSEGEWKIKNKYRIANCLECIQESEGIKEEDIKEIYRVKYAEY